MLVLTQEFISRADLQNNPEYLYLFGDNLSRWGKAGQAQEMRGEPNAFGIATKRSISRGYPYDYFFDGDQDAYEYIEADFDKLEYVLSSGKYKAVVVPSQGLGTGLARLPQNAPRLYKYIADRIERLKGIEHEETGPE